MREKDVHKLIEQQNPEEKQRVWEKLSKELNLDDAQASSANVTKKPKTRYWLKWAALASVLVCIVTLSVVLPVTLRPDNDRYAYEGQYKVDYLDQTLKEYSLSHNNELLYVDWYDIDESEAVTEFAYMNGNKNDIIFYSESIYNGETGEMLRIDTADTKTHVIRFDPYYGSTQEFTVKGVTVKWKNYNLMFTLGMFEYNGRNYYLELDVFDDPQRLMEIVEEMLK